MSEQMKILIAYDGSECADAALDDLRKAGLPPSGVDALVVSVTEIWLPPPPPSASEVVEAAEEMQTPADLRRWYGKGSQAVAEAERLSARAAELNAVAVVVEGDPKRVLVEEAEGWGADSIFVGSTGFSNRF